MRIAQRFFIVSLAITMSACGWHLRGSLMPELAIESIFISSSDEYAELPTLLTRQLTTQNISMAKQVNSAQYQLTLNKEVTTRRVVGVGGDALANAYELTLAVSYQIQNANAEQLGSMNTAQATRSYNYNASNPSSAQQEEGILKTEMRRDLTQQILRRMSILIKNQQATTNG